AHSARTTHPPCVVAQAWVRRGRGELAELGGQRAEGPQGRASHREEAGEAANDVVVGRRGDPAAGAVEAREVQAALMYVQEPAAAVELAWRRATGLVRWQPGHQLRRVGREVLEDRRDLAGVLA